jgi:hypothetical protein
MDLGLDAKRVCVMEHFAQPATGASEIPFAPSFLKSRLG